MNRHDRSPYRKKINGITVQTTQQKYSASLLTQITGSLRASRPARGAYRDRHGRWVRDAVDTDALLTNSV
jgi:hypothetical protein